MSREESIGMSFQQVYDAFQNDFHRTPQKIISIRNRNHLKSTVESNNNSHTFSNSNYSNYKSLDEEDQFNSAEQEHSQTTQSLQVKATKEVAAVASATSNNISNLNDCSSNNNNNNCSGYLNKDKMSPYDIEFDVLGNSLYESLQDCFSKTNNPRQQSQPLGTSFTTPSQFLNGNLPISARFKFEASLDNIYITEDNFESMEDEDKENKDPLENPQQFHGIGISSNPTSPQQFSQEEEQVVDQLASNQNDEQSSPYSHYNNQGIIDSEQIEINQEAFEMEEDTQNEQSMYQKSVFTQKKLIRFEQNLMTPLNDHHHKQYANEIQMRQLVNQLEEEVEQEEDVYANSNQIYNYNSIKQSATNCENTQTPHQNMNGTVQIHQDQTDQVDQVVRFKNQLETIIDFESNNNYQSNQSTYGQINSNLNSINSTYNSNNNNNNYNHNNSIMSNGYNSNNNSSLYQQHLLQSASYSNRVVRNQQHQQSSTNRTPLRDITTSSISSAKKNYQGIKKMLEFSSPMINNWDLKTTSQKSKTLSSKQKNSGSSKKKRCTPAIFCR